MRWGIFLAWIVPFLIVGFFAGQAMDDFTFGLLLFGVMGAIAGGARARR
ncbi:hypothetical protein [Deinococcus hohokamensis]|uniref:Uncharacterized protein n=1 Tax=Deinococcus hohokamensis TaxID=309883 RepID=A0ABV9IAG1_9DEIO